MASSSQLDDVLQFIGKYGRYQITASVFITIIGTCLPAWHMMGIIFSADRPDAYLCISSHYSRVNDAQIDEDSRIYSAAVINSSVNMMRDESGNRTLPYMADPECTRHDEVNGSVVFSIPCTEWRYSTLYNESTIVTDLDLVCDREVLAETAQSIFLVGMLVGSVVFGYLSDVFGRKIVLLGSCLANGVFGIAVAFVWNYPGVVILWFLVGMFAQGYNQVQFVMIMEMFPPECRTLAGSLNNMFWGVGIVTVTPIAYTLRNWRHMQLAISAPCLVAIPLWPFLDDSVRWLIAKGRIEDAHKILNKMARWNGVAPPTGRFVLTQEKTDQAGDDDRNVPKKPLPLKRECTFFDVLRSRTVLLNVCVVFFLWFVGLMTYYGASLNSSHLVGNKYANFLFLGLAEIPGYIIIHFTMTWWGRRPSLCLFFLIAGLASITSANLPEQTAGGTDLTIAIIAAAMLVKLCIVCAYSINLICCTEILPTAVRNIGFGIGAVCGNIGTALAPFVLYLDEFASYLPLSIFGGLCVVSALLVPILPETRNKPLPETLEEATNIGTKVPTSLKSNTATANGGFRHVRIKTDDVSEEDSV